MQRGVCGDDHVGSSVDLVGHAVEHVLRVLSAAGDEADVWREEHECAHEDGEKTRAE